MEKIFKTKLFWGIYILFFIIYFINAIGGFAINPHIDITDSYGNSITIIKELNGYDLDNYKPYEIVKNGDELILLIHFIDKGADNF